MPNFSILMSLCSVTSFMRSVGCNTVPIFWNRKIRGCDSSVLYFCYTNFYDKEVALISKHGPKS